MKKISIDKAVSENWGGVESLNYKVDKNNSIVYAKLKGEHGEVKTEKRQRMYYILSGIGKFTVGTKVIDAKKGDVIVIPPNSKYNYKSTNTSTLVVILFMELWDN
ncbi:hypothetical protein COV24_00445 [candidate division WWE3 bacterium CG10_big_fil_rev_8_21_14_0_10_32_10]|uniref:Cupin type-2 domain-containing protein n=1 Tax=candidate division WWE3 bacterium CG10_big_fil_rev_8_21_14_0_10_32_10 TaxID=1975090 RepID=A0A2H0RDI0_UNCKA|nr:MAG: hypothetical protein COV24_00445 [candidate division WWE3 bacterium CG10_big_fil_rev_8_21_14_0_10_32_10]